MIQEYQGEIPFHLWLQEHFRKHKNFGSKDRRFYRDACYAYFRCGIKPEKISVEEQICFGLHKMGLFQEECEKYLENIQKSISGIAALFPAAYQKFHNFLDSSISAETLQEWFSQTAPVFVVHNPGREKHLESELNKSGFKAKKTPNGFELPPNTDLKPILENGFGRIMDIGSQQSVSNLSLPKEAVVWDCCCGAGGKSLMLKQLYPEITLYCSDTRETIVGNLKKRFKQSGMPAPFTGVNNLANPVSELIFEEDIRLSKPVFDVVIADVPCSGSGTWRRNPEELHFFPEDKIYAYSGVQYSIASNAMKFLKPGGILIYVTCSVFREENSSNVSALMKTGSFSLLEQGYTGGPEYNGDYLFRAILQKTEN